MRQISVTVALTVMMLVVWSLWGQEAQQSPSSPTPTSVVLGGPTTFEDYYSVGNPKLFIGIPASSVASLLNSTSFVQQGASVYHSDGLRTSVWIGSSGNIERIKGPKLFFQGDLNVKDGDSATEVENYFKPDLVTQDDWGERVLTKKYKKCVIRITTRAGKIDFFELKSQVNQKK